MFSILRFLLSQRSVIRVLRAVVMAIAVMAPPVFAQEQGPDDLPTPSRVDMVSGEASFWRPGADNWSAAQINTPLGAGDALYTAAGATLEVQIGTGAFMRMAQNAMVTLLSEEPNLQQFKITSGIAAFDIRNLPAQHNIEIDTPSGVFTLGSSGYYRVEIDGSDHGATHFIVRRGGEATITLADGSSRLVAPSQEVVVETGDDARDVDTYVAPEADKWDEWNYARTDNLIDAISNRYVSPDVYGTDDLDHYGSWRVTPDYGAVWVPSGVASDWAPYSSGSWVWDPTYSWTWVDTAPWGWAPYHYGRWVNISGFWAWAPGPRHFHPRYAPALVAFFHGNGTSVRVSVGGPAVSWVALGWGEPCLPWWGRREFVGKPWWGGWGGPRVQARPNMAIGVSYRNLQQHNALIAVSESNFGHGRITGERRFSAERMGDFRPINGQHPVRPSALSMGPTELRGAIPGTSIANRPAVALHTPAPRNVPWQNERHTTPQEQHAILDGRVTMVRPPTRIDAGTQAGQQARTQAGQQTPWARFGKSAGGERNEPRLPPEPPRVDIGPSRAGPSAALPAAPQSPPQITPPAAPPVASRSRPDNNGLRPLEVEPARQPPQHRAAEPLPRFGTSPPVPQAQVAPPPPPRQDGPARGFSIQAQPPQERHSELPQAPSPLASPMPPVDSARPGSGQRQEAPHVRPEPRIENRPEPRTESQPASPPREIRQERHEHQEPPREIRQPREAPSALPGQPANQLYRKPQFEANRRDNDSK